MNKDETREKILIVLHKRQESARSRNSALTGIRDLARGVKKFLPKTKEAEVASNVAFLERNGFVEEVPVENYYSKEKFGNTKPTYKYRLSREGLAYFEHESKFDRGNVFAGIGDISGSGHTIIIGNSNSVTNLVNNRFPEGHRLAESLRRKINALGELDDAQKISLQADIETIKSQLGKEEPDNSILAIAKANLATLANIATVTPHAEQLFDWLGKTFGVK